MAGKNPLDFLGDEAVKLPVGGDFPATGFIGNWKASILYTVRSSADWRKDDGMEVNALARRKQGEAFKYYFTDAAEAKHAREVAPEGEKATFVNEVWYFQTALAEVLNVAAESKPSFSDPMSYEVQINTLRSKKQRHAFHFMALPSAVATVARLLNYAAPPFSLAELLDPDAIFTDDFRTQMIGDPDSGEYETSLLWQRRAALWQALGEKDAHRYTAKGAGTKFDTESDKLSQCLGIVSRNWTRPQWLRLLPVPDPRVDAVYGDERKRLNVPVIAEIFADAKAAQAAAQAELDARATATGGEAEKVSAPSAVAPSPNGQRPPVPANWAGMESDWMSSVQAVKAEYAGKAKPVVIAGLKSREAELAASYAATPADFIAWLDAV